MTRRPCAWANYSEAQDGTWRIVDVEVKSPEYPKVKVQIRWQ